MRVRRASRTRRTVNAGRRVPLTVTLSPEIQEFVESCVDLREFDSVDQLFDAALSFYRRHIHAINQYAEEQSFKGYSRAEALAAIECETFVVRRVAAGSSRRGMAGRRTRV